MEDEDYIRTGQGYIRYFDRQHEPGSTVYCGDHTLGSIPAPSVPVVAHVVIEALPPIRQWDADYEAWFNRYPHLVRRREWRWK